MQFKRPQVRYADTPQPATPYQSAAQVWDERIGSARVQAKNWRFMAFGCLTLALLMAGGLVWRSAQSIVTPYVIEVDPFARIGRESVTVQITSVVRASDTSFNVRWTEQRFVNGAPAGTERWNAVLSTALQTPRTEQRLRKNPLGIYVNGLSWSRELDSSEGAKP